MSLQTTDAGPSFASTDDLDDDEGLSLGELFATLLAHWKIILGSSTLAGAMGLGVAFLLPPTYTARTALLPPQQQQSGAVAALSSLGALAGLAGGAAGIKSPADQYIALMQSVTVSNRIIDQYKLIDVYGARYRVEAQEELGKKVRIATGKKDGLITIEVDDRSPERSAAIANSYVAELRLMTNSLAVSEAQQRRMFFEQQLQTAKGKLTHAQIDLQSSGFNSGALKSEPKAAAESYARLRAEVTTAEVKLQTLRGMLAENAPEIQSQQNTLAALRRQLSALEVTSRATGDSDYISRYREYKYQETLLEMFARQYELARVDESREGALIQVVDVATPPEKKSKPKRALIALGAALLTALGACVWVLVRHSRRTV